MADDNDKGFLSRWSQRKQARRSEEAVPDPAAEAETDATETISEEEAARRQQELDDYVASLPEPESLSYESDFTAFFKEGVPEALKRRALRVLWRSNPTLANLDGLIDYGDDYTNAATVVPNLKTLYKVGKGMFTDEEWEVEERKRAGLPPLEPDPTEEQEAHSGEAPDGEADGGTPAQTDALVENNEQTLPPEDPAPAPDESAGPAAQSDAVPVRTRPKPVEKKRSALARRWGANPDSAG